MGIGNPLVDGKECAYTFFDDTGKAHCGIERAYKDGAVIGLSRFLVICIYYEYKYAFEAVNYHRWNICSAACSLGKKCRLFINYKAALFENSEKIGTTISKRSQELQKQKQ